MYKHEFFDLQLHTDDELETIYGSGIVERRTLHEWPLSCVQLVARRDGTRSVYKSQCGPTLEDEVLQIMTGPILPTTKVLYKNSGYLIMDFEFIEAPLATEVSMSSDEAIAHGQRLIKEISALRASSLCPVWLDIGTVDRWRAVTQELFGGYRRMVSRGLLSSNLEKCIDDMQMWSESTAVVRAIENGNTFIHGDLAAKNVFIKGNGHKVIDWQRPLRAPAEVDLVLFLDSKRVNPLLIVEPHYVGIMCLTGMWWGYEGFCMGCKYEEWRDQALGDAAIALVEPERKYSC